MEVGTANNNEIVIHVNYFIVHIFCLSRTMEMLFDVCSVDFRKNAYHSLPSSTSRAFSYVLVERSLHFMQHVDIKYYSVVVIYGGNILQSLLTLNSIHNRCYIHLATGLHWNSCSNEYTILEFYPIKKEHYSDFHDTASCVTLMLMEPNCTYPFFPETIVCISDIMSKHCKS